MGSIACSDSGGCWPPDHTLQSLPLGCGLLLSCLSSVHLLFLQRPFWWYRPHHITKRISSSKTLKFIQICEDPFSIDGNTCRFQD